jgi:hypothetical protein
MTGVEPPRLHYWPEDCLYELMKSESMHYLELSNGGLKRVLLKTEKAGEDYRKFLKDYPEVMCESLDRYYLLRRATGRLCVSMLNDLLFGGSWREANWGAWLAALSPQPEFIALLEKRKPTLPHGTNIVDLALASCGAELPSDLNEYFDLLQKIRIKLEELPHIRTPMRIILKDEEKFKVEVEAVKSAYRSKGLSAARDIAKQGVLGYYSLNYKEWLKQGAPSLDEWLKKQPAPLFVSARESNRLKPWWEIW